MFCDLKAPIRAKPVFFTVFLVAISCGASPGPSNSPAAKVAGPRVQMPSGAVYSLEIARTPEEQAQGLMFRESLPPRYGMLFPFPQGGVHKFWMKNTMVPLDMIWLDREGKVFFVSADTPPCRADPCPNYGPEGPAWDVLEIAGGMAKREGVQTGVRLRFQDLSR